MTTLRGTSAWRARAWGASGTSQWISESGWEFSCDHIHFYSPTSLISQMKFSWVQARKQNITFWSSHCIWGVCPAPETAPAFASIWHRPSLWRCTCCCTRGTPAAQSWDRYSCTWGTGDAGPTSVGSSRSGRCVYIWWSCCSYPPGRLSISTSCLLADWRRVPAAFVIGCFATPPN